MYRVFNQKERNIMTPQTIETLDIDMSSNVCEISGCALECTPTTDDIKVTAQGFTNLNLSEDILKALSDMNFSTPSGIQAAAIPEIMMGTDIIAKAPTGSGKTAAFAIPILEKLDFNPENKTIQALVLCPTRELAIQVHREFEKLSKYQENVSVVSVYGGQQIDKQLSALKKSPQIVVATPGRLMDHLRRGSIRLDFIKMAVLDEADEMLDMGFRDDIVTILEDTSEERQTILFSATMPKEIIALTKKFQKSPNIVDVTDNLQNTPNIEQLYFEVVEKNKIELLTRLLDLHNVKLALVFCNTKSNVDKVVEILKTRGYFSDSLHGDMNQAQREKVMRGFRNGGIEILVATDVAGRGIDVKNIQAVFNYDLPRDDEDYIHRIGRTARAGTSGTAFTFVSKGQVQSLRRIERANGVQIIKKEAPTYEEIETSRINVYEEKIKNIIQCDDLTEYVSKIEDLTSEEMSLEKIAAALLKMSMNKESKKINKSTVFEAGFDEEESGVRRRNRRDSRGRSRDNKNRNIGKNESRSESRGGYRKSEEKGEVEFGNRSDNRNSSPYGKKSLERSNKGGSGRKFGDRRKQTVQTGQTSEVPRNQYKAPTLGEMIKEVQSFGETKKKKSFNNKDFRAKKSKSSKKSY